MEDQNPRKSKYWILKSRFRKAKFLKSRFWKAKILNSRFCIWIRKFWIQDYERSKSWKAKILNSIFWKAKILNSRFLLPKSWIIYFGRPKSWIQRFKILEGQNFLVQDFGLPPCWVNILDSQNPEFKNLYFQNPGKKIWNAKIKNSRFKKPNAWIQDFGWPKF